MSKNKGLDLGKEPILPLLLKMSWPSITAMLAMAVANLIDTFWLARLSTQALAALTICFPIQMLFGAIGVGTGVGAGSFAARMFGAGKPEKAGQTAGQVILLSIALGILTIIPVLIGHDAILRGFGAQEDILPLARQYLVLIVFGSPFLYFLMMANNLLRAEGKPLLSMYVVLTFSIVLIVLEPLLVFGWWLFPKLGIVGAALAAVISQAASAALSFHFLRLGSSRYHLTWRCLAPSFSICRSIYQTGLPSVTMNVVVSVVMVVYNHILAGFGFLALATLGLCFRINGLVTMILFGIGHGVMPMVAFSEGAGHHHRLVETVRVAVRCSALFALFSSLLLVIFARPILAAFSNDLELLNMSVPALRLFIATLVLVGPSIVWINMFIGIGKGTTAMLLMFIRDVALLIPMLFILPLYFGLTGIWIAQPLSTMLAFLMILSVSMKQIRSHLGKIA
jgi:putative MATE family efflux protein